MTNKHFLLFPSCVPVKGKKSGIIMDLDRGAYLDVPNQLLEILSIDLKSNTISEVCSIYNNEMDEGIVGYFQFLVDNQYGFFTNNPKPFMKPEDQFLSPYKVISSVIAIDSNSTYDLNAVILQLEGLSCQILQIRIYENYDIKKLIQQLSPLKDSGIKICELYIPAISIKDEEVLKRLNTLYANLIIICHSSNEIKQISISETSEKRIVFTTNVLRSDTQEIYDHSLFVISHSMYYESRHFNAGLNRKVCIDTDGSIKNYLDHSKSYGNVKRDKLENIIKTPEFRVKFLISNDDVEKCFECKFRYMCVSNSDLNRTNGKWVKDNICDFQDI